MEQESTPVAMAELSSPTGFPPKMAVAGHNLLVDHVTGEVVDALAADGIDCILLKGPALAHLLYASSRERSYSDIDLLVSPDDWTKTGEVLSRLGFVGRDPAPGIPHDRAPYGRDWTRLTDGANVDLHEGLAETTADRRDAWAYLWEHREEMDLRGRPVWVLDVPRRALLVGLHAAHHRGAVTKTLEDLRRALALVPEEAWGEAVVAAGTLGCEVPFANGLRMVDGGEELARRLGLPDEPWLAGLLFDSAEYDASLAVALGFERLDQLSGFRAKATFTFRKLFPPRSYMRGWMEAHPARGGMAVAYLYRLGRIAAHFLSGARRWRGVKPGRRERKEGGLDGS